MFQIFDRATGYAWTQAKGYLGQKQRKKNMDDRCRVETEPCYVGQRQRKACRVETEEDAQGRDRRRHVGQRQRNDMQDRDLKYVGLRPRSRRRRCVRSREQEERGEGEFAGFMNRKRAHKIYHCRDIILTYRCLEAGIMDMCGCIQTLKTCTRGHTHGQIERKRKADRQMNKQADTQTHRQTETDIQTMRETKATNETKRHLETGAD